MIGSQFPIILALLEYGLVLHLKNRNSKNSVKSMDPQVTEQSFKDKIQKLDYITMIVSFSFFVLFTLFYWAINS
jgi:hypothetical protein